MARLGARRRERSERRAAHRAQQSWIVSSALRLLRIRRSPGEMNMTNGLENLVNNIVAAVVFAVIGILLFIVAFMVFDKLTPGSLWKELLEDQNTALGVLMGCVAIALAIILAAAIH